MADTLTPGLPDRSQEYEVILGSVGSLRLTGFVTRLYLKKKKKEKTPTLTHTMSLKYVLLQQYVAHLRFAPQVRKDEQVEY